MDKLTLIYCNNRHKMTSITERPVATGHVTRGTALDTAHS